MRLHAIAFTEVGKKTAQSILGKLDLDWDLTDGFGENKTNVQEWTAKHFQSGKGLIFVGAVGIAVRAIASYIDHKATDPAVIVMDETGSFVIPILSGHMGGANLLARKIAKISGGQAVLTTATDVQKVWAVDSWAMAQQLIIKNPEAIKLVSSRLLNNDIVKIKSDVPLSGVLPDGVLLTDDSHEADVIISPFYSNNKIALQLIPKCIIAGIGCRQGISKEAIEQVFNQCLKTERIHHESIASVHSIDLKRSEPGLIDFCTELKVPFITHSAESLNCVEGDFTSSQFVKEVTGIDNVCERAALITGERLIMKKKAEKGATIALAITTPDLKLQEDS